ncbi:rRNA adenine N-6-methyltransferase family protein [uncultured Sphingomonas sp.]|uniref:protein-L-isoaspartate O-methyltransferase family protein n=1 Tax=uncultured Sphingomonas sp. TaxID=158754 RepID=UPI002611E2D8|nr:rRNA adenine N-6-methyltransferase family protein [uncultured Sphingomonas sp.]
MMATTSLANEFDAMRTAMVASQLRPNAVNDVRVVTAMAGIARETFVPAEAASLAYRDTAIPLGGGRAANLPIATGRLLTEAQLRPSDRVLLIGAATGYTATVLARLVAHVVAVESDHDLAARARAALSGVAGVELIEGPLEQGYAAGAPYDVMVIDGAVEELPEGLVAQVRADGRIVTGLFDRGVTRLAAGKRTEGGFGLADFADIECVVLPGFARRRGFSF